MVFVPIRSPNKPSGAVPTGATSCARTPAPQDSVQPALRHAAPVTASRFHAAPRAHLAPLSIEPFRLGRVRAPRVSPTTLTHAASYIAELRWLRDRVHAVFTAHGTQAPTAQQHSAERNLARLEGIIERHIERLGGTVPAALQRPAPASPKAASPHDAARRAAHLRQAMRALQQHPFAQADWHGLLRDVDARLVDIERGVEGAAQRRSTPVPGASDHPAPAGVQAQIPGAQAQL